MVFCRPNFSMIERSALCTTFPAPDGGQMMMAICLWTKNAFRTFSFWEATKNWNQSGHQKLDPKSLVMGLCPLVANSDQCSFECICHLESATCNTTNINTAQPFTYTCDVCILSKREAGLSPWAGIDESRRFRVQSLQLPHSHHKSRLPFPSLRLLRASSISVIYETKHHRESHHMRLYLSDKCP